MENRFGLLFLRFPKSGNLIGIFCLRPVLLFLGILFSIIKEKLKITKNVLSLPNLQILGKDRKHQNNQGNYSLRVYQGSPENQGTKDWAVPLTQGKETNRKQKDLNCKQNTHPFLSFCDFLAVWVFSVWAFCCHICALH